MASAFKEPAINVNPSGISSTYIDSENNNTLSRTSSIAISKDNSTSFDEYLTKEDFEKEI